MGPIGPCGPTGRKCGSLADTSSLARVEANLNLYAALSAEGHTNSTSTSRRDIASSSFGGHACAVQLKSSNCNALPVRFCQDRLFVYCFEGSKTGPKKGTKEGSKNGPYLDPKMGPEGATRVLKVGSRKGSQKGDPKRARSEILPLFTIL